MDLWDRKVGVGIWEGTCCVLQNGLICCEWYGYCKSCPQGTTYGYVGVCAAAAQHWIPLLLSKDAAVKEFSEKEKVKNAKTMTNIEKK